MSDANQQDEMTTRSAPTLTEVEIRDLVTAFYARARADAELGPVFDRAIAADAWPQHLDRMVTFWSSILLAAGTYRGNPASRHATLPGLTPEHFVRWLALFESVAGEVLTTSDAERVTRIATNMGRGLQRVALHHRIGPAIGLARPS